MPFGSYDAPKKEKTPTLLQFCKTAKKAIVGKTKFGVQTIWLPGKFDNVTLQTHAFRVIVSNSHPLYSEVIEYSKIIVIGNRYDRLDVVIDDLEDAKFSVVESTRVAVQWSKLGENGLSATEI